MTAPEDEPLELPEPTALKHPTARCLAAAYADPKVAELMVNADGTVYVEHYGGRLERIADSVELVGIGEFLEPLVGVEWELSPRRPFGDFTATDGSRVHLMAPPLVQGVMCVTIRKRARQRLTLDWMVRSGTLNKGAAEFLKLAVGLHKNILIVGGTSSGKTTFLNALGEYVDAYERIVVLEDTQELSLPQPHVVYLKARIGDRGGEPDVTLHDLTVNALRMRPDRIIIGEVRSVEAADMLHAMNVGHDGFLGTLHANSSRESLHRLESLAMMSGLSNMPLRTVRTNMSQALDLIVVMTRFADGARRVSQLSEISGMEQETILLLDLFKHENGELRPTGSTPRFFDDLRRVGTQPSMSYFAAD